jgi:hypothetical protein
LDKRPRPQSSAALSRGLYLALRGGNI